MRAMPWAAPGSSASTSPAAWLPTDTRSPSSTTSPVGATTSRSRVGPAHPGHRHRRRPHRTEPGPGCRTVGPDLLLAAVVGVRNVERDPARVIRTNTLAALHLLDWATPGARIFFASTSEVYAGGVNAGLVPVPTEDVPVMIADVTAPEVLLRDQQAARRGPSSTPRWPSNSPPW